MDGHADSIHEFFFSVLPFNLIYRDSIVCQGLCKILIDHVQGINTAHQQASQADIFSAGHCCLIHFFIE